MKIPIADWRTASVSESQKGRSFLKEFEISPWEIFTALRKASFASAVYVTANPSVRPPVCLSVCPFVCPSHSGIVSKRGKEEGCGLRRQVAQCL